MEPLTHQSKLIPPEEAAETGCFTTLPIRLHPQNDLADEASRRFMRDWAREMGDGRETRTYFSFSPAGNWSSLIYPEAIPERLGVLAYLSDLGLIHDDAGEELTLEEAQREHDELHAALNPDESSKNNSSSLSPESRASKTKKLVSQCMLECIKLDRELGLAMLAAFRDVWLAISERHGDKQAETVEQYLEYRSDNGGMLVFWPMLQFSLGMHMSPKEYELVQPIIDAATRGLLLANDYFSWEREYRELQSGHSKRMVSAVELFIRTQGLSIEAAKDEVKRMIIESEREFCRLRDELCTAHPDLSPKLRRWIDCAGLAVSGNHYWCSACPRQNAWKSQPHPRPDAQSAPRQLINSSTSTGKRALEQTGKDRTPETEPRKKIRRDSGVAVSSSSSDTNAGEPLLSPRHSPVSRYPLRAVSTEALDAPLLYLASMPSKGVRGVLIEALNTWLGVPAAAIGAITSVIDSLHGASLILDDLEDNSPLRRGLPSVHTIYGPAQAINSANAMFVRAVSETAAALRPASLAAALEELENLHRGQSWDLYWKYSLACPGEADYINMVDHKTGGMFRLLVRLMVAEAAPKPRLDAAGLGRLTLLFGRFFQIRDDYMNFGDYAAQKGFCEDLDEGKFSYPVVHCLANCSEYRGHILGVFRQRPTVPGAAAPLSKETKAHLLGCLVRSGSLDHTLDCLRELERELELEIDALERLTGEANPMLRLCLARLSTEGIDRVGIEGIKT
ncbi:hypothetical protein diail_1318 [Diaporthe ilicicola]|nr:hypothetical protein diail_1318 [Diaporthe ilicicola]